MIALANLPLKAREKFRALEDTEDEAQALVSATVRRISDLSHGLATAPASAAANMEHEISRLRGRMSEQQAKHQSVSALNAAIRQWLNGIGSNVAIEAAKPIMPKLRSGETLSEAVVRVRGEIAKLRAERQRTMLAGPTIAEMKAAAAEHVSKLAERGKPRLMIEHGKFEVRFGTETFNPQPDAACIIAWANPAAFLEQLEAQIDAMPAPPLRMTAKARVDRLAAIAATIVAFEREEEAIITELEEGEGTFITRRVDASPAVILGLILDKGKAASAAA